MFGGLPPKPTVNATITPEEIAEKSLSNEENMLDSDISHDKQTSDLDIPAAPANSLNQSIPRKHPKGKIAPKFLGAPALPKKVNVSIEAAASSDGEKPPDGEDAECALQNRIGDTPSSTTKSTMIEHADDLSGSISAVPSKENDLHSNHGPDKDSTAPRQSEYQKITGTSLEHHEKVGSDAVAAAKPASHSGPETSGDATASGPRKHPKGKIKPSFFGGPPSKASSSINSQGSGQVNVKDKGMSAAATLSEEQADMEGADPNSNQADISFHPSEEISAARKSSVDIHPSSKNNLQKDSVTTQGSSQNVHVYKRLEEPNPSAGADTRHSDAEEIPRKSQKTKTTENEFEPMSDVRDENTRTSAAAAQDHHEDQQSEKPEKSTTIASAQSRKHPRGRIMPKIGTGVLHKPAQVQRKEDSQTQEDHDEQHADDVSDRHDNDKTSTRSPMENASRTDSDSHTHTNKPHKNDAVHHSECSTSSSSTSSHNKLHSKHGSTRTHDKNMIESSHESQMSQAHTQPQSLTESTPHDSDPENHGTITETHSRQHEHEAGTRHTEKQTTQADEEHTSSGTAVGDQAAAAARKHPRGRVRPKIGGTVPVAKTPAPQQVSNTTTSSRENDHDDRHIDETTRDSESGDAPFLAATVRSATSTSEPQHVSSLSRAKHNDAPVSNVRKNISKLQKDTPVEASSSRVPENNKNSSASQDSDGPRQHASTTKSRGLVSKLQDNERSNEAEESNQGVGMDQKGEGQEAHQPSQQQRAKNDPGHSQGSKMNVASLVHSTHADDKAKKPTKSQSQKPTSAPKEKRTGNSSARTSSANTGGKTKSVGANKAVVENSDGNALSALAHAASNELRAMQTETDGMMMMMMQGGAGAGADLNGQEHLLSQALGDGDDDHQNTAQGGIKDDSRKQAAAAKQKAPARPRKKRTPATTSSNNATASDGETPDPKRQKTGADGLMKAGKSASSAPADAAAAGAGGGIVNVDINKAGSTPTRGGSSTPNAKASGAAGSKAASSAPNANINTNINTNTDVNISKASNGAVPSGGMGSRTSSSSATGSVSASKRKRSRTPYRSGAFDSDGEEVPVAQRTISDLMRDVEHGAPMSEEALIKHAEW
jgi:hypothetical protein